MWDIAPVRRCSLTTWERRRPVKTETATTKPRQAVNDNAMRAFATGRVWSRLIKPGKGEIESDKEPSPSEFCLLNPGFCPSSCPFITVYHTMSPLVAPKKINSWNSPKSFVPFASLVLKSFRLAGCDYFGPAGVMPVNNACHAKARLV
jgi:hypothetical protein